MQISLRQQTAPFWHSTDDSDPNASAFYLRPLTELEKIDVFNELTIGRGKILLSSAGVRAALSYALLDWRNVNADGQPLSFSADKAQHLPQLVQRQLASVILAASELSDEQKKT